MAEEWRVTIALDGAPDTERAAWRRCMLDVAREMRERSEGAVAVPALPGSGLISRLRARFDLAESPVVAYADSRGAAELAARVAEEVTGQRGVAVSISVACWRPVRRRWEDAATVSRRDLAKELRSLHEYKQREDRRLSAETGVAQWRVRVELHNHRDTVALAQRLSADGHHLHQAWKSVVADADSEDDAHLLAEKVQRYAPADAKVHAERAVTTVPPPSGESRPYGAPPDMPPPPGF